MKAMVILSHSWTQFLPLTYLYGKNERLWVSVKPSVVFSQEETPQIVIPNILYIGAHIGILNSDEKRFKKLFLFNIINHDENDSTMTN